MTLTKAQSEAILKTVQKRINEFLGSDVDNLSNISKLHEEWDNKRKEIEQSLTLASDEVPSKVGKITKMLENTSSEISSNCHEISLVLTDISKETCRTDDLYLRLKENFDKINQLTNAHAYLSIIDFIEHLSNRMEGYVASRETNMGRAIDEYKKLGELCVKVNTTSCSHLRTYLVDTLKYWHAILKKDFVVDFGTCLKNVQWPIVSSNNLLSAPSADALSKFQHGLKRLLHIAIPYYRRLEKDRKQLNKLTKLREYFAVSASSALVKKSFFTRADDADTAKYSLNFKKSQFFFNFSRSYEMKDRFGSLSFAINDWKEFLVVSKQSFKKKLSMKSPNDVSRDDFDIMRTLGSGSFGRVVLARRKSDNQYFAIKVLDKAKVLKTKQVEHTLNEKQILQAIRCPFTIYLEHFFQDNLYLFFVLPLILGGEMFSHLRKIGKFQENATKFYAAQVVLAFEYLHYLDLVYRDLKPENILIDHVGYLKITDFGFCKVLKKRTYTVCGTPEYLAPEIILRKGYGHSVDWWTLGVLIYEMAAGYPPFSAKDTMKLYERIVACKYHFPTNFSSDVKEIIKAILQVDISKRAELDTHLVSSSLVLAFPTPTVPVVLLIQPLRKRFLFHFSGNSKTNRIDKPEWYFTQVLTWIKDHESFILNWVQPIYDDMNVGKSALAEFMAGLVELSLEKLQVDIEQAQFDDITFSHMVDEALAYERELRHTYLYPQALPGPVHILSRAQLFVKWLSMEKKYAREKMDIMIKSETAWSTLAGDQDEGKVTEVAHSFLALLSTMSDRYNLLPQPGHRLQFVELVLEIIDDFRVSLLQVLHSEHNDPLNSKLPQVLNTVFHVRKAIEQYDASPSILLLNHYRTQFNTSSANDNEKSNANPVDEPGEGIFQSSLALLERLESQLLTELCDNLMMEVMAKSRPYRKDKWFGMTEEDVDLSIVTLSGCGMYQALADQLHLVHGKIAEKLFSSFWKMVANNICSFFLDEIVLDNYFNPYGGQVLEKDVNKFLIPLFQHYCEVPGTYFAKLQEACRILALPTLSNSVRRAALCGNGKELLAALDIPLIHITGERLCTVITRRVDVVPSLM